MLLQVRFDEILDDPIADLKQLQETEGTMDYHARFEVIKTRVKLSEEYLVSAYLACLRMDTQMHIRMFQPQNTRQCLLLGRSYEKAHPKKPFNTAWSNSRTSSGNKCLLPFKKDLETKEELTAPAFKPNEQQYKPQKFLTNEEMGKAKS